MSCTAIKIHLFRPMKSTEKAEFHLYIKIREFRKEHRTSPVKRTKKESKETAAEPEGSCTEADPSSHPLLHCTESHALEVGTDFPF